MGTFSILQGEEAESKYFLKMEKFESEEITKDMKIKMPPAQLKIKYGDIEITPGKIMTPTQVQHQPTLSWDAEPGAFYTIIFSDPDNLSRADPNMREYAHWAVGNVPDNNVAAGETLVTFIGSGPKENTGIHRYVFLVFKQPGKLAFEDVQRLHRHPTERIGHKAAEFAHKFGLELVAGNFYQAEYDDYVPSLYEWLLA